LGSLETCLTHLQGAAYRECGTDFEQKRKLFDKNDQINHVKLTWCSASRPTRHPLFKAMTSVGIIADDYTGALMVACYLEAGGIYAPLVFRPEAVRPGARVIVAGARTRTVAASDALSQVAQFADAFAECGYSRLLYKVCASFDSTPEGNIGSVADYLADRTRTRPVLMAAGLPEFNITTHFGYLFYRGRLVIDSIKRFDPLTPMSDPDIVRFLSLQTSFRVGLVDHLQMKRGCAAVTEAVRSLEAAGNGHVFFDVSDHDDIQTVVDYAAQRQSVLVASDAVAVAYARKILGDSATAKPLPRHAAGPAAVLAGTVGPVIDRQLRVFSGTYPSLFLDITDSRPLPEIVEEAVSWAANYLGGRPFAITTAADEGAVGKAQYIYGAIAAARRAETLLSEIAKRLHRLGVRRFVVAGGETSGAVVSALGIGIVRAFPEGPLGTGFCVTEGEDPVSMFLKPGKHGRDDILLRALEHMV
jgi:uncharacterized protein YgbK (DUF1537 family)